MKRVRCPPSLLALAVTAGALAYVLAFPLVIGRADESHLLHGAWRVLHGQVLYRDFYEIIPPLAFLLFAAVYALGGPTLAAARTAQAGIDALGAGMVFVLVRRVAGAPEGLLAALALPLLCVPVWPYASAHWLSTTLGLITAVVLLDDRWQASRRLRPLIAGMLAGAAIGVQQQRGPFLLLWVVLATFILDGRGPGGPRWGAAWRAITWTVAGASGVLLVTLGHAMWAASPREVFDGLIGFAMESYAPSHAGETTWAGVVLLGETRLVYTWQPLLRWSPLLVLLECATLAAGGRRPWSRSARVRAALCLLAGCMAASVWYLPDIVHTSFVLPFLLIPGARVVHGLRTSSGPVGRGLAIAVLAAALVMLGTKGVRSLTRARAAVTVTFETAFGSMQGDAFLAGFYEAVRRHLVLEPDGTSRLYSYPDDAWLYPALGARDAFGWDVMALTFPPRYHRELVDVLRRRDPGTLVVLSVAGLPAGVRQAIEAGYDRAEHYYPYDIYVRRSPWE